LTGILTFTSDEQRGLICVHGSGVWTPDYAREHFEALGREISQLRASRGRVAVLVDVSASGRQSDATGDVIRQATETIYNDADRVAIVAASIGQAEHIRQFANIRHLEVFTQLDPALDWIEQR
jgi:hypothetical protein